MTLQPDDRRHAPSGPGTQNHRLATLVFLMAGTMLFAGMIGGYLVLRYGAPVWPGPGLPRLPVRLAGCSTVVIALSSLALHRGVRALRGLDAAGLRRALFAAAGLGVLFMSLQVAQWTILFGAGLSFSGTTYGSTFYVLTGMHAAHALSGIVWLLIIAFRQRELWVPDRRQRAIEVCALYWHFVGVVWIGLYVVLYLI
ncbi:MAG TPA: heme-copper oxidase subunit III [Candidatus Polarisedimenticolia bacterium]|jgi:cytochrome c oxidase subunit 3|nr:heme-copper oxidase subunit III [Candidatus Polarisedimenticolia bacterium]